MIGADNAGAIRKADSSTIRLYFVKSKAPNRAG